MDRNEANQHRKRVKGAKAALALAALSGINAHLRSMRGAQDFGASANAQMTMDGSATVQVDCTISGVPVTFEFTVRELIGSSMG
jgi:hypothetical protein